MPAAGLEAPDERPLDVPAGAPSPASAPAIVASSPISASPSAPAFADPSLETSRTVSTPPAAKGTPAFVVAALLALGVIIAGTVLYKQNDRQKSTPLPISSASDQRRPSTADASGSTEAFAPAGEQVQFQPIPAGTFTMGCTHGDSQCDRDESPPHRVTLSGFLMAQTETTKTQYGRCVAAGACNPQAPGTDYDEAGKGDHPVVSVTWGDAAQFCGWAGARLPTEAEWEYAARGGRPEWRYPWGVSISHDNANYKETGERDQWSGTSPVSSFEPNGYGLYDMSGNAWEWVADWYGEYPQSDARNPIGPTSGYRRVIRGGAWSGIPRWLRVSYRVRGAPGYRLGADGFRCARSVDGQAEVPAAERMSDLGESGLSMRPRLANGPRATS
jgi:formylglycine-generating enzyme required for sulfatase activity